MCFSLEASFGLAVALLPAGAYCVRSAFAKNRAFLCVAIIPLAFGTQQLAEGAVWLGVRESDSHLTRVASLVFLAFALAFWPFWVPLCAFLLEEAGTKKWLMGCFAFLGLIGGMLLFLPLVLNPQLLHTRSMHHSLFYDIENSPVFQWMPFGMWEMLYLLLVAAPTMISRTKGFFLLGVAIVLLAAASHLFFWYASVSVWCFFAAILSLYLCVTFRAMPEPVFV